MSGRRRSLGRFLPAVSLLGWLACGLAALAGGLAASARGATPDDGWRPPRLVRLEGAGGATAISPVYGAIFRGVVERTGKADAPLKARKDATYVLVRPGEIVLLEGRDESQPPFPYRAEDGRCLVVGGGGNRTTLGGKTVALELGPESEAEWRWLETAPPGDLAALRLLALEGLPADAKAAEAARRALDRLAEANPWRVDLAVGGWELLRPALARFDPAFLSIESRGELGAEEATLLAEEPRLDCLLFQAKTIEDLGFLARLPRLRTLLLSGWSGRGEGAPPPALPTLPNLRTLIVPAGDVKDLAPVGRQPHLQELAILFTDALTDLRGLAHLPDLRALVLTRCEAVKDLSPLSHPKRLRWLSLPPGTTQAQFERVCRDHPGLVILQAFDCPEISDLSPIENLSALQVLCVPASVPPEPVAERPSLRLLGVQPSRGKGGVEGLEGTEKALVRVMAARPDLVVVEAAPMCLGSGWVLVLAPLALGAWVLARRGRGAGRSSRGAAAPDPCDG